MGEDDSQMILCGGGEKKIFLSGSNRQAQFNSSVLDYLELSVTQVKGDKANKNLLSGSR